MKGPGIKPTLFFLNALLLVLLLGSILTDPYALIHRSEAGGNREAENWTPARLPERKPLSHYSSAMLSKRLFQYGLREEAPVAQKNILQDFVFLGSSQTPRGPKAFLRNTISKEMRTVAVGDTIGEYMVEEITGEGIKLSKGEEPYLLKR